MAHISSGMGWWYPSCMNSSVGYKYRVSRRSNKPAYFSVIVVVGEQSYTCWILRHTMIGRAGIEESKSNVATYERPAATSQLSLWYLKAGSGFPWHFLEITPHPHSPVNIGHFPAATVQQISNLKVTICHEIVPDTYAYLWGQISECANFSG